MQVVVASAHTQFKDIDLDRNPVIALECGHLLTTTEMDEILGIASAYAMLADGKSQNQKHVPVCIGCRSNRLSLAFTRI